MCAEVLNDLARAILEYDAELAASSARKAVEEGIDPVEAMDAMTTAIRQVGDAFGREELWLPELVAASDAMSHAMSLIEEELHRRGARRESPGTVVAGTVFGDLHSIGKTMVTTLLTADGFAVHDLGVNIRAEEFVDAVKRHSADVLALSALMTTTIAEQEKVIEALKEEELRDKVKVMVGGAAVTQGFANRIGADGYDPTAPGAVRLTRRLLGI